jgi:type I restriction enzyme S subunit
VTIVRTNPELAESVVVGYAMLHAQSEIEQLGEGSTGQTELSRQKLGRTMLTLPDGPTQKVVAPMLNALERRSYNALQENDDLASLRDTLLPQLLSGDLRIRDAERLVSATV